jgi:hypothetical protein
VTYALAPFHSISLDEKLLALLIDEHETIALPRLMRLWRYYRNALAEPTMNGGSTGAPAQRSGLPPRLISESEDLQPEPRFRREIVIENDIAWRIHALVDFMFPAAPRIVSQARGERQQEIQTILNAIFDANGGIALWQNAALLGSVYGHIDFLINCNGLSAISGRRSALADSRSLNADRSTPPGVAPSKPSFEDLIDRIRSTVLIETIEAPRAISLLNRNDYRVLDAYIVHFAQPVHDVDEDGWLTRLMRAMRRGNSYISTRRASVTITEIHSATSSQRYEDGVLISESINRVGRIPVVHIQNLSQPLRFEGLSDVEPLIPLQDELNTRLSDRANRVTMQSFRMWLGKGIENFDELPVGPGQMWSTDNLEAEIESFGGDADSPSERQHLEDLREALDRASGVTPAAAGHIKARVGNLTSENALRISLMGTIAKIKRKRITYGTGIRQLCELILHALDVYGVYRTTPRERQVEIAWPDPLPTDESRRIEDALRKAQLGVPTNVLRAELGYPDATTTPPTASTDVAMLSATR